MSPSYSRGDESWKKDPVKMKAMHPFETRRINNPATLCGNPEHLNPQKMLFSSPPAVITFHCQKLYRGSFVAPFIPLVAV